MSILSDGQVGPRKVGDGTENPLRTCNTGEIAVSDAHARFYESAVRGNIYHVANQSGITTQAGLSATTPPLTLYNPAGSGVNGVIIYAGCVNSVAFAAAAVIWVAVNTNIVAAAVTGTLTTAHRSGLLGSSTSNKVQALLAATLPAAPVAVATLGVGLTGAITLQPTLPTLGRFFDGGLILYPGAAISLQTSTASGASGFFGEFIWEEVLI